MSHESLPPTFPPSLFEEIDLLASASLRDELTDDQATRLEQLVLENPAARRLLASYLLTSASLQEWVTTNGAQSRGPVSATQDVGSKTDLLLDVDTEYILSILDEDAERAKLEAEELAEIERLNAEKLLAVQREQDRHGRLGPVSVRRKIFFATLSTLAAATIISIFLFVGRETESAFAAKIVGTSELVWVDAGESMQLETILLANQTLEIESGLLEIEFGDGAQVVLEGPARFTIESHGVGDLQLGKLAARVPSKAIGFTIKTPSLTLVDLGTEFGLEVESSGATRAETYQGLVELHLPGRGIQASRTIRLTKNEAARFDLVKGTLARTGADASRFVRSIPTGHSSGVFSDHFDPASSHTHWDGAKVSRSSIWDGVMVAAPSGSSADRIDASITNPGVLTISVSDEAFHSGSDLVRDDGGSTGRLQAVAGMFLRVTGDFDVKVEMPAHGDAAFQTHSLGAITADRRNFVHIDNIADVPEHVRFRAASLDGAAVAGRLAIPQQRWFRMTRKSNMFRGFYGDDGTNWTEVGSGISRPSLPATLRVGLFAWPFHANAAFEAQFDHFELMISGGTAKNEERKK